MSTTNKILKTAALIGFVDGGISYISTRESNFKDFNETLDAFIACTTLPALVVFGIDKLVNQNITSNKNIQYGLTTVESYGIASKITSNSHDDSINISIKTFIICKSLAFKYIWDSRDETPELDQTVDSDLNLDALNVSAEFGSL
jgi:hypothetical protein